MTKKRDRKEDHHKYYLEHAPVGYKTLRKRKTPEGMWYCFRCDSYKPITDFGLVRIRGKRIRSGWCRKCNVLNHEKWRASHGDFVNEYARQYRKRNHESRVIIERRSKAKHRESRNAYNREWSAKNADKHRQMRKAWKMAHPDKNRQYKLKRKALAAGLLADFTSDQWLVVLEAFNNGCAYCRTKENGKEPLHQDHFISVANRGGYTMGNIVPACRKCNCGKAHRDSDWVIRKFGQAKYDQIVSVLNELRQLGD